MGRSLQDTMINIGINGACDEAMYQVSHTHPPQSPIWEYLNTWLSLVVIGETLDLNVGIDIDPIGPKTTTSLLLRSQGSG